MEQKTILVVDDDSEVVDTVSMYLEQKGYSVLSRKKAGPEFYQLVKEQRPNLIILDGMKCFISGGPAAGEEREPRCVIVGDDRVAVDAVGVAVLKAMGSQQALGKPTWEHDQIKRA